MKKSKETSEEEFKEEFRGGICMKQVSEFKEFRGDIHIKASGGHLTTPYAGPCDRTSEDGWE